MKLLLLNNGSSYIDSLKQLLPDFEIDLRSRDNFDDDQIKSYDLVVLSGGRPAINSHLDLYSREINLIRNGDRPILGICLGCELIAYSFGAKLSKLEKREKGFLDIEIIAEDKIFEGVNGRLLRVFENHLYSISGLPGELEELAKSQNGPEIIKHKSRPIYGFQFHPEMITNQKLVKGVFQNTIRHLTA